MTSTSSSRSGLRSPELGEEPYFLAVRVPQRGTSLGVMRTREIIMRGTECIAGRCARSMVCWRAAGIQPSVIIALNEGCSQREEGRRHQ